MQDVFTLTGYGGFLHALLAAAICWGIVMRLCAVAGRTHATPFRVAHLVLSHVPAVVLGAAWVISLSTHHSTYWAIWGYLHPGVALTSVGFAVACSALICLRAWRHGDVAT
jgi:hypothetical protein